MNDTLLKTVADALGNISGSIAEILRADAHNTASPPHVEQFEECLARECRRLRAAEQDGLAASLEAMGAPLLRIMREGW